MTANKRKSTEGTENVYVDGETWGKSCDQQTIERNNHDAKEKIHITHGKHYLPWPTPQRRPPPI